MIRFLLPVLVFVMPFLPSSPFQGDFVDEMSALFKAGNSREIAKSFSPSVELSLINEEDVYSKLQAEQILRDFFTKHPAVNSTVIHLINTNPNIRFGILSLATKNGKFRVSITSKKTANVFLITSLRIEAEK
ncbi:DUF4783 domain-containing protein [Pedobacter sp. HMWF019]|uniref:DUF4783 domain-containing protein n=1 Tax=Pedobacter sp. HMWF019 TaxID=2056856 RepID=UPI000D37BD27|nr:DUF4783 domain-containing protein [Pedobacter sp. HMWF019]PTS92932.1 DUF4783 domain-containing protein [Pedobacter sp. HMWF019]